MWVDDEEMKDRVLKAISNRDLRSILTSLLDQAKSVSTLALELAIPLSTTYNYIHEASEAGLVAVERVIITDGKRNEMYRCVAKEVRALIESRPMLVEILPNENVAGRFYRLWSSLKKVK